MTAIRRDSARRMRTAAIGWCLTIASPWADAQSGLSATEAAQLYTAAGFPVTTGQPVNRCGRPAKPRVTFVDINGDKQPEALFVDEDAGCYAPSGRYFAVLTKQGTHWRPVISGGGSIQAQQSRTGGWLDMRVSEPGCTRGHRFDGRAYKPATGCAGEAIAAAPQPALRAPSQPAAPRPALPPQPSGQASVTKLPAADEAAAYRVAGFKRRGNSWHHCDDPTPMASSGGIEQVADLNGDGLPEAVIVEGGTFCYGNTGQAFWLVSKLPGGGWKLMGNSTGIAQFLETKGVDGWPDISIGGPGFCFPVARWNGREYKHQRWEYEGKACRPPR